MNPEIPLLDSPGDSQALTVSQLTARVKGALEDSFPNVWVRGEISNLSQPQSGHVYFTLKDANAQIRGVMWRSTVARLPFELRDGLDVLCRGGLEVYPPRGSYQLVAKAMEPVGVGALQLALRKLQQKLAEEGLFSPEHKRPLPSFARRIGFVTSPSGAAVRDFLEVVRRRFSGVEVFVIPARVQGEHAAGEIVAGIEMAQRIEPPLDCLVIGRGGGSLEDLWCFNEEAVVRAIFACTIPTISAVGHEIDVTLSDLVADRRALTPSEAAEIVTPSSDEVSALLRGYRQRLAMSLRGRATRVRERLEAIQRSRAFRMPRDRVHELSRRLDELELSMSRAIARKHQRSRERVAAMAGRLEALSPLAVLSRGYSITQTAGHEVITSATQTGVGDLLTTRLAAGKIVSRVESIDSE